MVVVDRSACIVATSGSSDLAHVACLQWLSVFVVDAGRRDTFVVQRRVADPNEEG